MGFWGNLTKTALKAVTGVELPPSEGEIRYEEYKDAVMDILKDLDVPVIFDADIGHMGPQFSWIMGAKAKVTSENGKGALEYIE